ncbi:hypothetical protein BSKO_06847 [Bryopsis sp. KO-2023]|nr:hypothetical protein BSKO_06847 [Bryopsis sp. KO-2023]
MASPCSAESKHMAKKLLKKYKTMIDDLQNNVNPVNIATMLHRIAKVSTLTAIRRSVSQDKLGLIQKLSILLGAKQQALQGDVISACLWSYSKLGAKITSVKVSELRCVGDVVDDLFTQAQENPKGFTCQSVTDLLHAFVALKRSPREEFLTELISHAKTIIEHASFRSLTRMPWYFAKLKYRDDRVGIFPYIVRETETRIRAGRFDIKGLAITVAAWGELDLENCNSLLDIIDMEVAQSIKALSPQDVVNFVTGFSALGYLPSESVLRKLSLAACRSGDQIDTTQLIRILQGYSGFGVRHERLVKLVTARLLEGGSELSLDDVAVACESLAILEALNGEMLRWAKSHFAGKEMSGVSEAGRRGMYLASLHGVFYHGFSQDGHLLNNGASIESCRLAWKQWDSNRVRSNILPQVLALLSKEGHRCEEQYEIHGPNFTVASVHRENETPCVVDVYDVRRVFVNVPNRLRGCESWRVRVLRNAGFRVCWLDAKKWGVFASGPEKLKYLEAMLERAR